MAGLELCSFVTLIFFGVGCSNIYAVLDLKIDDTGTSSITPRTFPDALPVPEPPHHFLLVGPVDHRTELLQLLQAPAALCHDVFPSMQA